MTAPGFPGKVSYGSQPVAVEPAQAAPPLRIAQPEEVAELIVFLASHQARLINGQRLQMR